MKVLNTMVQISAALLLTVIMSFNTAAIQDNKLENRIHAESSINTTSRINAPTTNAIDAGSRSINITHEDINPESKNTTGVDNTNIAPDKTNNTDPINYTTYEASANSTNSKSANSNRFEAKNTSSVVMMTSTNKSDQSNAENVFEVNVNKTNRVNTEMTEATNNIRNISDNYINNNESNQTTDTEVMNMTKVVPTSNTDTESHANATIGSMNNTSSETGNTFAGNILSNNTNNVNIVSNNKTSSASDNSSKYDLERVRSSTAENATSTIEMNVEKETKNESRHNSTSTESISSFEIASGTNSTNELKNNVTSTPSDRNSASDVRNNTAATDLESVESTNATSVNVKTSHFESKNDTNIEVNTTDSGMENKTTVNTTDSGMENTTTVNATDSGMENNKITNSTDFSGVTVGNSSRIEPKNNASIINGTSSVTENLTKTESWNVTDLKLRSNNRSTNSINNTSTLRNASLTESRDNSTKKESFNNTTLEIKNTTHMEANGDTNFTANVTSFGKGTRTSTESQNNANNEFRNNNSTHLQDKLAHATSATPSSVRNNTGNELQSTISSELRHESNARSENHTNTGLTTAEPLRNNTNIKPWKNGKDVVFKNESNTERRNDSNVLFNSSTIEAGNITTFENESSFVSNTVSIVNKRSNESGDSVNIAGSNNTHIKTENVVNSSITELQNQTYTVAKRNTSSELNEVNTTTATEIYDRSTNTTGHFIETSATRADVDNSSNATQTNTTKGYWFKYRIASNMTIHEQYETLGKYLTHFLQENFQQIDASQLIKVMKANMKDRVHQNSVITERRDQTGLYAVKTESFFTKRKDGESLNYFPSTYKCSRAIRYCSRDRRFCQYQEGDIKSNIILAVPHGGVLKPDNLTPRPYGCYVNQTCVYGDICATQNLTANTPCKFDTSVDVHSKQLGLKLAYQIQQLTGQRPHLIMMNVHRSLLDVERMSDNGAYVDEVLESVWYDFHRFIGFARNKINGRGLVLNLHTHQNRHLANKTSGMIKLCYTMANESSKEKNIEKSSMQSCFKHAQYDDLNQFINGKNSFKYLLQRNSITSQMETHSNPTEMLTKLYGSYYGGLIDAMKISVPRKQVTGKQMDLFINRFSKALIKFMEINYG